MPTFTDNAAQTIAITVAAIKRIWDLLNVDLNKLVDDGFKPLGALVGDPAQLADMLYGLCKEEAYAKQISDEDFGRALGGDAITLATEAFVEELFVFLSDAKIHDREGRPHRWSMASPW